MESYKDQIDLLDCILDLQNKYNYTNNNIEQNTNKNINNHKEPTTYQNTTILDSNNIYNTQTSNKDKFKDEIEKDCINNNLMLRLNSELDIKKGNDKKKKNIILKPFIDKGPSLYKNVFNNEITDFTTITHKYN